MNFYFFSMCQAIRFQKNDFDIKTLQQHRFESDTEEIKIYFARNEAYLPVLLHGQNKLIRWGNKTSLRIPRTGFCTIESFQAGKWLWLRPMPIAILASSALVNGVWFQVKEGIRGLLIKSESGSEHCYMLTQPATHYFRTMTGAERMPVLINQRV